MRNCEDCKACCEGYLIGSTRGSWFGNLKSCKYLEDRCTIYNDRPGQCRRYFCAWAQELLPESMRPDKIDTVVSVEVDNSGNQFLKVMCKDKIDADVISEIDNFCKKNNTYFTTTKIISIEASNVS